MEAKYKVGEKVRFNYPNKGVIGGVVFGIYNLKGDLRYSIRSHSQTVFYTVNEDKIVEKVK
jgi:hypothetical protein